MLDQAKNNTTLLIKEALHIPLTNLELINRDKGVAIKIVRNYFNKILTRICMFPVYISFERFVFPLFTFLDISYPLTIM